MTGDSRIDLSDTLRILSHFGHFPGDDLEDVILDRYIIDPQRPWAPAPATGSHVGVDLSDALVNLQSFGTTCLDE